MDVGMPKRSLATLAVLVASGAGMLAASTNARAAMDYVQTNLVSDGAVPAALVDPNLVNAWGIAQFPNSPFV
jgi:hypothetical protein